MKKTATNDPQPCRERNIAAIVAYFESGIKRSSGMVGIELEHTLVHRADGASVTYSEEHGTHWLLEQLRNHYPDAYYDNDDDLLGLSRVSGAITESITLEPAAQVELSAGPFASLEEARACFESFEVLLTRVLDTVGQETVLTGYHPTALASEAELIPKRRYKFMDMYLSGIGPWGPRMMRNTASTQVSIDYTSVEDCLRKLRLANLCVPAFSLMTDNSPLFEGAPRTHELMRTEVWRYCDPDRCNTVPGVTDGDFSLERYAAYILDTPAILLPCEKTGWCYAEETFGEHYAETPMQQQDVEHALSMLFNDVRLKTYIEIRPADAMPIPYVIAYAALVKGLFADEKTLTRMERLFDSCSGALDIDAAKSDLMAKGYKGTVYGMPAGELCAALCDIAESGLDGEEAALMQPLVRLVESRSSLADRGVKALRSR